MVDVRVVIGVEGGGTGARRHCVHEETLDNEALFCRNTYVNYRHSARH